MAYSPAALTAMYDRLEPHLSTLRRGGIYANKSGYHNSRTANRRNWPGNYSIIAPADLRGDPDAAAGIDISLGPAEMKLVTRRLIDACERNDPRIECLREVLGTLDGRTVDGYNRYASGSGSRSWVGRCTADSTHLWHVHISFFRDYATNRAMAMAVCDVILGVPLGSTPTPKPEPEPKEWYEMALDNEAEQDIERIVRKVLEPYLKDSVKVAYHYPVYTDEQREANPDWNVSSALARIWEVVEADLQEVRATLAKVAGVQAVLEEMAAKGESITAAEVQAAAERGAAEALTQMIEVEQVEATLTAKEEEQK